MASAFSDEVFAGSARQDSGPGGRKRGRPSSSSQVQEDGPSRLAIIVSEVGGRWAREMDAGGGCAAGKAFHGSVPGAQSVLEAQVASGDDFVVVGLAVVQSWRCVTDRASHTHSWQLMELAKGHHGVAAVLPDFVQMGSRDPLPEGVPTADWSRGVLVGPFKED